MSVIEKSVRDHMEKSFIDYAMSTITERALPDIRDGLKPVHRRIMFSMNDSGFVWNKPYKKSARIVGDVIGKYHPHGDVSVYDAAVRMAQVFSMNHPLIDGQGNYGSIDGDNPAAMRYTEMRLSRLADEMFSDLRLDTVKFRPNYDGSESEPEVLPVSYPNILVNGAEGIAVGMACNIPPHNLSDVIKCIMMLLDDPDTLATTIASTLQAPDFPTGGIAYGMDGFIEAVETGRGKIHVRAKWHEEERARGGSSIVIDEIPYQVNKATLVSSIAMLVREKLIDNIVGLRDESNKDGIRIVIDIRSGTEADVIFSQLCSKTSLDVSVSYNCVVIDGGRPVLAGLLDIMRRWIEFRRDVVYKRIVFRRKQALAKLHILSGFTAAIGKMDAVIALVRKAASPSDARNELQSMLSLDEQQAQAILDLRLQKLTGMEIDSLQAEHAAALALVADLDTVLSDPSRIDQIIREELESISSRYGAPRKTEVQHGLSTMTHEDMIPREPVLIAMTRGGYVKRLPVDAISQQNRGTRGKRVMEVDGDEINVFYQCESHDLLAVFTETGKVHAIKAYRVPECGLNAKGRHIRNVIDGLDEEVSAMVSLPESDPLASVITITKKGQIKRSEIVDYASASRRGGIRGVSLDDGDALLSAYVCRDHDHIMLVSNIGKAIRFNVEGVRVMGRVAGGVRGMKLGEGEVLVGSCVIHGNGEPLPLISKTVVEDDGTTLVRDIPDTSSMDRGLYLLCVGELGVGKRTEISEFNVQNRAGKGVICFKAIGKTGLLTAALAVSDDMDVLLFSKNGISNRIPVKSIPSTGRATSGVYMMNLDDGDKVARVTTTLSREDDGE